MEAKGVIVELALFKKAERLRALAVLDRAGRRSMLELTAGQHGLGSVYLGGAWVNLCFERTARGVFVREVELGPKLQAWLINA